MGLFGDIADVRGEGWMLQRLPRAKAAIGDREDAVALLARATGVATHRSDEELMEECVRLRRTWESVASAPSVSTSTDA